MASELPARLDLRVVGVADDDARRLEAFGGDAPEALAGQQRTHAQADLELLLAYALETVVFGFPHHVAQGCQRIGRHRRVIGVAAIFEGLHDLHPLLEVAGEAAAGRGVDPARARSPSTTRAQQGKPVQPFCGALISTSTALATISTQTAPEATQSRTKRPSTARTASPTARR
jgi:hypothetical protein